MPDIYQITEQFRRRLLAQERAAAAEVAAAYTLSWARVKTLIDDLLAEWEAGGGASAGQELTYRYDRLRNLEQQITAELQRFSDIALLKTTSMRDYAALLGTECAADQLAVLGMFGRLPTGAVEQITAALSENSPLNLLLSRLPDDGARLVSSALIEGMALGQGVGDIARSIRAAMGMSLTRALRISRTETLRAYRQASLASYGDAGVSQWEWRSARNERTCAACWGTDGTLHNVSEPMASHVNCRCVPLPVTPAWSSLGYQGIDELPETDSALERFDNLGRAGQLAVLGRAKLEKYLRGELSLPELVGKKYHPLWGWSVYEKSLREIVK